MAQNRTVETIELTAVDKFSAVFKDAKGSVTQLGSAMDALNNTLAGVGVALGAGAFVALHHDAIRATAALDDMAESTGASVESLSKLQGVAKVGGHDFAGLTDQIGKMIKGLKSADEDGQKAAYALDYLGVKAKDANGRFRDTGQVVIEIAQALSKYEDNGNKVAIVQDALGKGAQRYLPLLKDIAENGDLVARRTADQASQAEQYEKAIGRLNLALEDARYRFASGWVPTLTKGFEQMAEGIKLFGSFTSALYNIGFAIDPFKDIAANMRQIREELERIDRMKGAPARLQAGFMGAADEPQLRARLKFLQFMERQQVDAKYAGDTSILDARDLRARQRVASDYQSPSAPKNTGPDDGAQLILTLRDQLDAANGQASAFDSVMRKLTEGTKAYTLEVQATALALAGEIDLQKQAAEQSKRYLEYLEQRAKLEEERAAQTREAVAGWNQRIRQMEFENGLIQSTDEVTRRVFASKADALQMDIQAAQAREKAIAFRQIDLEAQRATIGQTEEETRKIYELAEAKKAELGALIDAKVAREKSRDAAQAAAQEWKDNFKRVSDDIERALTQGIVDSLMNGFRKGESFAKNFVQTLKNAFASAVLTPVIQAIVRPVAQGATGLIASSIGFPGIANAASGLGMFVNGGGIGGSNGYGLGGLSNISSIGNLFGGGGGFAQTIADFGNFFGNIGQVTEMGNVFGLGDAISGFAMSNPWTAVAAIAAPFVLDSLFGGGGGPKESEAVLGFNQNERQFGLGDNNAPGAAGPFAALAKEFSDPALYDVDMLANLIGPSGARRSFWAGPGDVQDLISQVRAFAEPARVSASQKNQASLAKLLGLGSMSGNLQGYVDSLATSEFLTPMDRLANARTLFQKGIDAGDPNVGQMASQLLSVGREVYASGPEFQALFREVNTGLADALQKQQDSQVSLMKEIPAAILETAKDQIAAVKSQTEALVDELRKLAGEVRRLGTVM